MEKEWVKLKLDLQMFFKGFVRNYAALFLGHDDSLSTFTHREVEFWMKLGEMMGFLTRQETGRKIKGKTRKTDLLWFKDNLEAPILHLESENWSPITCIKTRLDTSVPYLVLLIGAGGGFSKSTRKAAERLLNRSPKVKEFLIVTYDEGEDYPEKIPMIGAILQKNKEPDIVQAYLINTGSGFLYGVLEEDEEDDWVCEYCDKPFSTLRAAERHEVSCPKKPVKN